MIRSSFGVVLPWVQYTRWSSRAIAVSHENSLMFAVATSVGALLQPPMDVILEAVNGNAQRPDTKIDAAVARLSDRISLLEEVVRKHSGEIRALREEVASLRDEVTGLRHDFDHRQELGRVGALEARVSAIESRLAIPFR
jgi:hypothetical protein